MLPGIPLQHRGLCIFTVALLVVHSILLVFDFFDECLRRIIFVLGAFHELYGHVLGVVTVVITDINGLVQAVDPGNGASPKLFVANVDLAPGNVSLFVVPKITSLTVVNDRKKIWNLSIFRNLSKNPPSVCKAFTSSSFSS